MTTVAVLERLRARARLYEVLSRFYDRGLTRDLVTDTRGVEGLNELLAPPADFDEAASEHYRLLGLQIPPYASVFLDSKVRLGGDATAVARRAHLRAGLPTEGTSQSEDHVAGELLLMAHFCRLELDARESQSERLSDVLSLQREFLDHHVLWWLPAFVCAVARIGAPVYRSVAMLTLEAVADHRSGLGSDPRGIRPVLPPPEDPLVPGAGVREIASFLVTPARSGVFIARADIEGIGRRLRIPRGFGDREAMLVAVFQSATELGHATDVLDAVDGVASDWSRHLSLVAEVAKPAKRHIAHWRGRVAQMRGVVARLREALVEP